VRLSGTATQNINWGNLIFGAGSTKLVTVTYFRFPSALPTVLTRLFKSEPVLGGAFGAEIRFNPTGNVLEAQVVAGTIRTGPVIVVGQWYRVETRFDVAGTTYTLDWAVDGVDQLQASATGQTASTAGFYTIGWGAALGASSTVDFDDVGISITTGDYKIGPMFVTRLGVDTAGTLTINSGITTNWDTFAGATPTHTAWNATTARDAIDEVPPNAAGGASQDGFSQIVLSTTDFVNIPMTSYQLGPGEKILGARMVCPVHADTNVAATIGFRYITTGVEQTLRAAAGWGQDNAAPWVWVCSGLTLADIDTQVELDALVMRVGYSGDATPKIGIQGMYVELAIAEGYGPKFRDSSRRQTGIQDTRAVYAGG